MDLLKSNATPKLIGLSVFMILLVSCGKIGNDDSEDSETASPDNTQSKGGILEGDTVSFQQGESYDQSYSFGLSNLGRSDSNEGGTTFGDGNANWCIGKLTNDPGHGYDETIVLKFEGIALPEGKSLNAATLTLTFVDWQHGNAKVEARYLRQEWSTDVVDNQGGVTNAPLSWVNRTATDKWSSPGATGLGTDVELDRLTSFPSDGSTISANGIQSVTSQLDIEVVQNWLDNPANNHGLVLQVDIDAVHIGFYQTVNKDLQYRPKLVLYFD